MKVKTRRTYRWCKKCSGSTEHVRYAVNTDWRCLQCAAKKLVNKVLRVPK